MIGLLLLVGFLIVVLALICLTAGWLQKEGYIPKMFKAGRKR